MKNKLKSVVEAIWSNRGPLLDVYKGIQSRTTWQISNQTHNFMPPSSTVVQAQYAEVEFYYRRRNNEI